MNNINIMLNFINTIYIKGLMTQFIINIFDYDNFNDNNYFFRIISLDKEIIIDIYDNVSKTRFNRYIFLFIDTDYDIKILDENGIFVNYIGVLNTKDSNNKLLKLGYLFNLDNLMMIEYSRTFLDDIFVEILKNIIK